MDKHRSLSIIQIMVEIPFKCTVSQLSVCELDPDLTEVTVALEKIVDVAQFFVPTPLASKLRVSQRCDMLITSDEHPPLPVNALTVTGYTAAFDTVGEPGTGLVVMVWLSRLDIADPDYSMPDDSLEFDDAADPLVSVGALKLTPELAKGLVFGELLTLVLSPVDASTQLLRVV